VPSAADIERLSRNIPKQEAGRVTGREISVSRANRSVRLFEHVVDSLAAGRQPDAEQIKAVGYLMRTTAVYGSGKLGAADREAIAGRPEFDAPFQPEMLSVFLTRAYTLDLVEHLARLRAPETAIAIDPGVRRRFGVGNSTGLGLGPFIINHPVLFNNWIAAREEALARVRALPRAGDAEAAAFRTMLARARLNADEWRSEHSIQIQKVTTLKADLAQLDEHLDTGALDGVSPWDQLYRWGEQHLSIEGQEQLVSLLLEPFGALVDDLAGAMSADEGVNFRIDGAMTLARLREIVEDVYGFALKLDWAAPREDDWAQQIDQRAVVAKVLSQLSPDQRRALVLFEQHGLSIREVSEVMGKKETAVRVLLHRSRQRTAELLKREGIDVFPSAPVE